jgi:hypothetical protein
LKIHGNGPQLVNWIRAQSSYLHALHKVRSSLSLDTVEDHGRARSSSISSEISSMSTNTPSPSVRRKPDRVDSVQREDSSKSSPLIYPSLDFSEGSPTSATTISASLPRGTKLAQNPTVRVQPSDASEASTLIPSAPSERDIVDTPIPSPEQHGKPQANAERIEQLAASDKWACSACTFENVRASAKCAMCETPRALQSDVATQRRQADVSTPDSAASAGQALNVVRRRNISHNETSFASGEGTLNGEHHAADLEAATTQGHAPQSDRSSVQTGDTEHNSTEHQDASRTQQIKNSQAIERATLLMLLVAQLFSLFYSLYLLSPPIDALDITQQQDHGQYTFSYLKTEIIKGGAAAQHHEALIERMIQLASSAFFTTFPSGTFAGDHYLLVCAGAVSLLTSLSSMLYSVGVFKPIFLLIYKQREYIFALLSASVCLGSAWDGIDCLTFRPPLYIRGRIALCCICD